MLKWAVRYQVIVLFLNTCGKMKNEEVDTRQITPFDNADNHTGVSQFIQMLLVFWIQPALTWWKFHFESDWEYSARLNYFLENYSTYSTVQLLLLLVKYDSYIIYDGSQHTTVRVQFFADFTLKCEQTVNNWPNVLMIQIGQEKSQFRS